MEETPQGPSPEELERAEGEGMLAPEDKSAEGKRRQEELETEIKRLVDRLYNYAVIFDSLGKELQEDWYWAEQEAAVGQDRQQAKRGLEGLLTVLESIES